MSIGNPPEDCSALKNIGSSSKMTHWLTRSLKFWEEKRRERQRERNGQTDRQT